MTTICLMLTAVSLGVLYQTSLEEERARLTEIAQSQARLIEAVARFDQVYSNDYPQGPIEATLSQIRDSHDHYEGFGQTGEFTLARLEGEQIVFLLNHRHHDYNRPAPINISSPLAEPMRLALSGKAGTVIGLDYRGRKVLAAYEPVGVLNLGIVAKLDMAEIRAPFIRAALFVTGIMIVLVVFGAALFNKLSSSFMRQLEAQNRALAEQIEERKRSEASLQQKEAFLKTLLDAIPIPVFYKDKNGRHLGTNRALESFLGQPDTRFIGKSVFDLFPPKYSKIHSDRDQQVFSTGERQEYESLLKNTQGLLRNVVFNKAAFKDAQGAIGGLIGTITDITENRQAEAERRDRELLLNEMGRLAKIGGWEHDLLARTAAWTEEIYRIVEIDESDPIPGPDEYFRYCRPEDRLILEEAYSTAVATGKPFDLELQCVSAKGRRLWVRVIGRPEFKDGKCVKMKGTFQDITESKKMKEMFHQSQKMESIGNLAGGVAHDYNNMLSVIIGYTEMALEKVNEQEPLHKDLMAVLEAAKRSSEITRQLLAFARKQTIAPKVVDLNDAIEGTLKMLQRLIGEDIDLSWQPGIGVSPVKIDPTQIDQILANLCVNARDAITDVGKVTIETADVCFDEDYCNNHPGFVPGDFVMIAVSDNGSGMAAEIQNKIFDPFFTTKGLGKGTGLGLSTVYGIVKQNNGFINVYSEPGKGPPSRSIYHGMKAIRLQCNVTAPQPCHSAEAKPYCWSKTMARFWNSARECLRISDTGYFRQSLQSMQSVWPESIAQK